MNQLYKQHFGTITRRTRSKKGTTRKERRKAIKKKS
jgi:hypothetical protein